MNTIVGGKKRLGTRNGNDDLNTPPEFIEPLHRFNDGPPTLDPCSNLYSAVGAHIEFFGPPHGQCGLTLPWSRKGLNYSNPPYSAKRPWMHKSHVEAAAGCEIIVLIPADTDTRWFHDFAVPAQRRLFWKGRFKFRDKGLNIGTARFASLVVYWGPRVARFDQVFGKYGFLA